MRCALRVLFGGFDSLLCQGKRFTESSHSLPGSIPPLDPVTTVFEVTAPFTTPEITLKPFDRIVWNPSEVYALQKRRGVLREISLPQHFGAQLLAHGDDLFCQYVTHPTPSFALAAGAEQSRPESPRRLLAPRHLHAL
jgi:hypothetical protein